MSDERKPGRRGGPDADELPPHSVEAEMGVLGCLLLEPALFDDARLALKHAEAFYDLKHQLIWEALSRLIEDAVAVDLIMLQERLKLMNQLDQVGGIAYLMTLADVVPSAANLKSYLDTVGDYYLLRRMIRLASEGIRMAYERPGGIAAREIVTRFDQRLFDECVVDAAPARLVHIKQALGEVITDIENTSRGVGMITGFATGLGYLDKKLGGFRPTELIAICARPAQGKTSLAGTLALNTAIRGHVKLGFFTMEMSYKAIAFRLLCGEARVNGSTLRDGFPSETTLKALAAANGRLAGTDIWFDDSAAQDIEMLRASARRMVKRHGVQMIMVDYWQLMKSETKAGQGRANELGHVSNGLKALAMELKIPVILLAQLNREYEKGQKRGAVGSDHPRMSDIKDCGSLEQDADVVLMIYANTHRVQRELERLRAGNGPKKELNENGEWEEVDYHPRDLPYAPMNLWLEKQRNGPTQIDIELNYQPEYTLFTDAYENRGKVAGGQEERGGGAPSRKPPAASSLPDDDDFNEWARRQEEKGL